jgi:hypothetical protein
MAMILGEVYGVKFCKMSRLPKGRPITTVDAAPPTPWYWCPSPEITDEMSK